MNFREVSRSIFYHYTSVWLPCACKRAPHQQLTVASGLQYHKKNYNLVTLSFSESPKFICSWLAFFTNTYSPCLFTVCVVELSSPLSSHLSYLRTHVSSVHPLLYCSLFHLSDRYFCS